MKKQIAIVAKSLETLDILRKQLHDYFNPYCGISSYLLDDLSGEINHVDMVLLSSKSDDIFQVAKQYIPEQTPVWVINRLFEPKKLKWLMQIPSGTEVLVINNLYDTCNEVIQTLLEANMNHLRYIPYYPGCTLQHERYRYGVTLGKPEVILPYPLELIDIGIRRIHIHDLLELGRRLGIPLEKEKEYLSRYIAEIHDLGKQFGNAYVDIQNLHIHLQSIFEAVQEPIFACDKQGKLSFMNKLSTELFECSIQEVIGQPIERLPYCESIIPFLASDVPHADALITIKNQYFIVNCKRMVRQQEYLGMVCILKNVTEIQSLERRLRKGIVDKGHIAFYTFAQIIGKSQKLLKTIEKAKKMAKNNRSILIFGENGTGKELFAHAIHMESPRKNGPFVAINCASLPENLLESEIFGYEEGAFTGARKGGKPGVFEQADGGTIFLDEIGDISPGIQVRLLRVLQEKQVVRVGGTKILTVDVRVIAATNRNLEAEVKKGSFREDLYYRLNVLPIEIPSLRERKDDIPLLLEHQLKSLEEAKTWDQEVIELFMRYDWPGNIRELINVVEYSVTVTENQRISLEDIPPKLKTSFVSHQQQIFLKPDEAQILRCIYQYSRVQKSVGRYELMKNDSLNELHLTEQKLRTKLRQLLQKELIAIGTTKQGTVITERGIQALQNYRPLEN